MWQALLDRLLTRLIRSGTLHLTCPDGTLRRYGDATGRPVSVRISDPGLIRRLLRDPGLALGEGYMDGTLTIEQDDLHGLLELALRNLDSGPPPWTIALDWHLRRIGRWMAQFNPGWRARANVAHHYDLPDALYALFLDSDRQYSCAYFREPGMTLEAAQQAKKDHIAAKLLLEPGMEVLEIGCGWGGLALDLARRHGVRVTGITLSEEQLGVAERRAHEAGLAERVRFRLADYRGLKGQFDRIVSVGMFEHVGAPQFRRYFRELRDRLRLDGVALIHFIGRMSPPGTTNRWIARYIFPGGYVPALSEVMAAVEREGLWTADIEVLRGHYAETLRHWHDRFMANLDAARAIHDDRFCRMWRFYLVSCEQTFRFHRQCVFQIQMARRQDVVPATRDYLHAPHPGRIAQAAE